MQPIGGTPRGVERLEIGAVIGDEDAPLFNCIGKLIFIGDTCIGAADIMNRDGVGTAPA